MRIAKRISIASECVAFSRLSLLDLIRRIVRHGDRTAEATGIVSLDAPLSKMEVAAQRAAALIDRTFANRSGADAACAEARDAMHGGLRLVLDSATERSTCQQPQKHVNRVLVDALDWQTRAGFMACLLHRLDGRLPQELHSSPPDRLTRERNRLSRGYAKSIDQFKQPLRTL
jgi:hypothetical protein